MPPRRKSEVRPRIRVTREETIVLGPGKADLLDAIAASGSLRSAAAALGMSYMRAWSLVRTMNGTFREPLVEHHRGGAAHGSTQLTPAGVRVAALYRAMEERALRAIDTAWRKLERELK
jgi:molybdate transport system regulatory protein